MHISLSSNKYIDLTILFFTLGIVLTIVIISTDLHRIEQPPRLIAHAGGAVNNIIYSNSLQALDSNYDKGFRYFELDIEITSDRKLVLVHYWDSEFRTLFTDPPPHIPTYDEFMALNMKFGLQQLSMNDVYTWLESHPDAYVITDVKSENLFALTTIMSEFPEATHRVIPQFYDISNFQRIQEMGYEKLIFTLYKSKISDQALMDFSDTNSIFAYTMFPPRGINSGLGKALQSRGEIVYYHTIDDQREVELLIQEGAYGFYTDHLNPRIFN